MSAPEAKSDVYDCLVFTILRGSYSNKWTSKVKFGVEEQTYGPSRLTLISAALAGEEKPKNRLNRPECNIGSLLCGQSCLYK